MDGQWLSDCVISNYCSYHRLSFAHTCVMHVDPTKAPATTCQSWCANHATNWAVKCSWTDCGACSRCSDTPVDSGIPSVLCLALVVFVALETVLYVCVECRGWCRSHFQPWRVKCTWSQRCDGCSQCSGVCRLGLMGECPRKKNHG